MANRSPLAGLAHVRGPTDTPLLDLTIPDLLARAVSEHADTEAAVFRAEGIRWNYAEFARHVDRLAGGLLRLGVAPGDRVGIWSPNNSAWLLTQFATARIGAILVCINPAYRPYELEFALNKVGCSTLITAPKFKTSDYVAMLNELAPELSGAQPGALAATKLPDLKRVIVIGAETPPGMFGFDAVCKMGDAVPVCDLDQISTDLSDTDPINIQFTSGTTGRPKGACLTHRNIVNNANSVTATLGLKAGDRLCIPVPFYHCFGMVMGTLGCVTKGATMVIPGEGFDAEETLATVSQESCTALYGVPTMFVAELAQFDPARHDLSNLSTGIMAGASCPIEVMRQVQSVLNMEQITIAYGMTETSPVSFQSDVDDPIEKRVSTVGRIHPHVECKIVDSEGRIVAPGIEGELMTRGYSVMQGYWGDADRTTEAICDGWMKTGDLASIDAEGYCEIKGRVKDMILRGGENVYPSEIESFLFTHPDIAQAQVFGIPDARLGEVVCAWVVLRDGATLTQEDVRDFCRDAIAHYKVPTHVRIKDDLPMTVTGKPQKFIMREQMVTSLAKAAQ